MTTEQRFSFDEVTDLYDRTRPGYPDALFDDLISLSAIAPGGRILEIGCGTGQATVPLARRGFRLLCLEPGPAMARFARDKLARFPEVEVLQSTFEELPIEGGAFSLVVSAQAFHWVAAEARFPKAAAALDVSGALAVIGNAVVSEQSPLRKAIDAVYARHAPTLVGLSATRWYSEDGPVPGLFAASGCFGPVTCRRYPWSRIYSPSDYCDLLRTHSDHRMLARDQLESLLEAISEAIQSHEGQIEVAYDTHLYLAWRTDQQAPSRSRRPIPSGGDSAALRPRRDDSRGARELLHPAGPGRQRILCTGPETTSLLAGAAVRSPTGVLSPSLPLAFSW